MTTQISKPEPILWLNESRGIHIPRDFANSFINRERDVSGVDADDWKILETGPNHEWYWEAWDNICDNACVTDENGIKYSVYQNGDCWLIPHGMEWSDRDEFFLWPEENSDEENSCEEI